MQSDNGCSQRWNDSGGLNPGTADGVLLGASSPSPGSCMLRRGRPCLGRQAQRMCDESWRMKFHPQLQSSVVYGSICNEMLAASTRGSGNRAGCGELSDWRLLRQRPSKARRIYHPLHYLICRRDEISAAPSVTTRAGVRIVMRVLLGSCKIASSTLRHPTHQVQRTILLASI